MHNATLGVLLSLRHGNAKESAISYLVFGGIFLGGIAGRHARGHAFGKLALGLVEKLHNPWLRAEVQFVRGYFATSWLEPAKSAEQTWRLAWHSGVDVGDFFHAGCAARPMTGAQRRAPNAGDCDSHTEATPQSTMIVCSITPRSPRSSPRTAPRRTR